MDLTHELSVAPWQARPGFMEDVDRPMPLIYLINGGEDGTKKLLARGV
jgi:L-fucose isomerase